MNSSFCALGHQEFATQTQPVRLLANFGLVERVGENYDLWLTGRQVLGRDDLLSRAGDELALAFRIDLRDEFDRSAREGVEEGDSLAARTPQGDPAAVSLELFEAASPEMKPLFVVVREASDLAREIR